MKLASRCLGLFLSIVLALPAPAFALRIQQSPSVRSGLEEAIRPGSESKENHYRELLEKASGIVQAKKSKNVLRPSIFETEDGLVRFQIYPMQNGSGNLEISVMDGKSKELRLWAREGTTPVGDSPSAKKPTLHRSLQLHLLERGAISEKGAFLARFDQDLNTPLIQKIAYRPSAKELTLTLDPLAEPVKWMLKGKPQDTFKAGPLTIKLRRSRPSKVPSAPAGPAAGMEEGTQPGFSPIQPEQFLPLFALGEHVRAILGIEQQKFAAGVQPWNEGQFRRHLRMRRKEPGRPDNPRGEAVVLENQVGVVVGYLFWLDYGDHMEVANFGLRPDVRISLAAGVLLDHLKRFYAKKSIGFITVETLREDRHFYEASGFLVVDVLRKGYEGVRGGAVYRMEYRGEIRSPVSLYDPEGLRYPTGTFIAPFSQAMPVLHELFKKGEMVAAEIQGADVALPASRDDAVIELGTVLKRVLSENGRDMKDQRLRFDRSGKLLKVFVLPAAGMEEDPAGFLNYQRALAQQVNQYPRSRFLVLLDEQGMLESISVQPVLGEDGLDYPPMLEDPFSAIMEDPSEYRLLGAVATESLLLINVNSGKVISISREGTSETHLQPSPKVSPAEAQKSVRDLLAAIGTARWVDSVEMGISEDSYRGSLDVELNHRQEMARLVYLSEGVFSERASRRLGDGKLFGLPGSGELRGGLEELMDAARGPVRAVAERGERIAVLVDPAVAPDASAADLEAIAQHLRKMNGYPMIEIRPLMPGAREQLLAAGARVMQLRSLTEGAAADPDTVYVQAAVSPRGISTQALPLLVTDAVGRWQNAQGRARFAPIILPAAHYLHLGGLEEGEIADRILADRFA